MLNVDAGRGIQTGTKCSNAEWNKVNKIKP